MEKHYSLTELSEITGVTPRTIRFYMSKGLVDKPLGARKTAYYTDTHLQQLLTVIKWQKEGLSLEVIAQQQAQLMHKTPPRTSISDIKILHRLHITEGVELTVDLARTSLSKTDIRQLADQINTWIEEKSQESEYA